MLSGACVSDNGAVGSAPRGAYSRIIGSVRGDETGATVVCVAGQHGNEASGVIALERVFEHLASGGIDVRGEIIGVCGNVRALELGVRFVSLDLNRMWTTEQLDRVRALDIEDLVDEEREQRELHDTLVELFDRSRGAVHVLDMHTTSSDSEPFAVIDDALRNRAVARQFPTPIVLGMEEVLIGTLPDWVNGFGYVSIGFEAGQHDAVHSVERHEAGVWVLLVAAGVIDEADVPELDRMRRMLSRRTSRVPRFLELVHHHPVEQQHRFQMEPGFENFQRVQTGELLAKDHEGEIRCPRGGRVFMPLYQLQGDDGFFVIRGVLGLWLWLSKVLRLMRADRVLALLPGVRRSAHAEDVLIADGRVARLLLVEVFHLLGYRRRRVVGESVVFSRRMNRLHDAAGSDTSTSE